MDAVVRNVLVRVYDGSGRPQKGIGVVCHIYQFAAGGQKSGATDAEGRIEFYLDIDAGAEIAISVDRGRVQLPRGAVKADYRVVM